MKASLLTNFPSSSRKWEGLKLSGLSHSVSSHNTDVRRGYTTVPCRERTIQEVIKLFIKIFVYDMAVGVAIPLSQTFLMK